jgi:hypothetical protein
MFTKCSYQHKCCNMLASTCCSSIIFIESWFFDTPAPQHPALQQPPALIWLCPLSLKFKTPTTTFVESETKSWAVPMICVCLILIMHVFLVALTGCTSSLSLVPSWVYSEHVFVHLISNVSWDAVQSQHPHPRKANVQVLQQWCPCRVATITGNLCLHSHVCNQHLFTLHLSKFTSDSICHIRIVEDCKPLPGEVNHQWEETLTLRHLPSAHCTLTHKIMEATPPMCGGYLGRLWCWWHLCLVHPCTICVMDHCTINSPDLDLQPICLKHKEPSAVAGHPA